MNLLYWVLDVKYWYHPTLIVHWITNLKLYGNFLKAFRINMKASLGLVLPNQYCPIVVWKSWGWYLGDAMSWTASTSSSLLWTTVVQYCPVTTWHWYAIYYQSQCVLNMTWATVFHADNTHFFAIVALYSMSLFNAVDMPLGRCTLLLLECACTLVYVCL